MLVGKNVDGYIKFKHFLCFIAVILRFLNRSCQAAQQTNFNTLFKHFVKKHFKLS